ncbi:hypothetical protein L218DRAFT_1052331 [Marasmius fiardii PR-910]|nr:hypothetical protein L218DRAFT_1052331 [Marasmius fiardii PR-910]
MGHWGKNGRFKKKKKKKALEKLEKLVVQWLFELTKLNRSDVGYKQHNKISKALNSWGPAIQTALNAYNALVVLMLPPQPTLVFDEIVCMVTVADFDLLKDTQNNVTELIWAWEENCKAMRLHFHIQRVREELEQLHVEMQRLITFLIDDHADYYHAIQQTLPLNLGLASELSRQQSYWLTMHERIVQRLVWTRDLKGFAGTGTYSFRT